MFSKGQLTRTQGVDPRSLTFAAIDLETTGLHPNQGSRVCEIGIVRMRGDGVVLDEYSSLVNPELRITNDVYHGISNADVKGAPTFAHIAGDVLAFLSDAIVVSHNLEYEEKFLAAEFGRLGIKLNGTPALCTLIATRTQLDQYGYRLNHIANLLSGEWSPAAHSALGDARTLASLLATLIGQPPRPLYWKGAAPVALPALQRTGYIAPRAAGLRKGTEGWLASLTARLPYMARPPAPRAEGVRDYRAMLGHALADGKVISEEATQLATLATRAGLTQLTARQLHEQFLTEARGRAEQDGTVTSNELKELQRAAKELASSHLISDLEAAAAADRAKRNGPLKGWRILPVDDSASTSELVDFAVGQGATVAVNVTKTVKLVVNDSAGDDDPRIVKARKADIDVVHPDKARQILEDDISNSGGGLFANSAGAAVSEQLTAERAADAQSPPPEWHQHWRPKELTAAQYKKLFVDRFDDWDERQVVIEVPVQRASAKRNGCAVTAITAGAAAAGLAELVRQIIG